MLKSDFTGATRTALLICFQSLQRVSLIRIGTACTVAPIINGLQCM